MNILNSGEAGDEATLLQLEEFSQRTDIYARDGSLLAVIHAEENRQPVTLDKIPELVQQAILDVEDDRFWDHGGVDLRSTLRAVRANVNAGSVQQGGSTITQQLVKNALLTPERSVSRKVREAVLALRLEKELTKHEILERYLNTVYFGNGAYGVQAAAETYFNTDVQNLDEAQAALLAGIIRNPEGYDPLKHPAAAKTRRSVAFDRMVVNGHLTPERAAELNELPVPTSVATPLPPPDDYFVEEVKQRLLDDVRLGDTPQERYNALFKGGLKIYTTLDPKMQDAADAKVRQIMPNTKGKFTAALATVEPGSGAVRAMVAGSDFLTAKYNLATARGGSGRQPGSSFKPIVLLAALDKGYSPRDTIDGNTPCTLKIPGFAPYDVENYEGGGGGTMSLTDATINSVNCAYVRLGAVAGLDNVVDMADKLGIPKSRLNPFPSISLGAQEVSPLEMAAAYAAIANDGVFVPPTFVEKVVDRNGKTVFEGPFDEKRAVDVEVARQAVQVMQGVVQKGTGTRARIPGHEVAGKTGTSQNHENAWFVGFTKHLSTAVWVGSPAGNVAMKNVGGIRVTGGSYPARIFSAFMTEAHEGLEPIDFADPDPRKIPRGKFIKDGFGKSKPKPKPAASTSTLPTETTVPGPVPTTPTTAGPATTTTVKKPTTTTSPPTTQPPNTGEGGTG